MLEDFWRTQWYAASSSVPGVDRREVCCVLPGAHGGWPQNFLNSASERFRLLLLYPNAVPSTPGTFSSLSKRTVIENLDVVADAAHQAIRESGVHTFHVLACSWGTITAQLLACRYPHAVNSLCLFGPECQTVPGIAEKAGRPKEFQRLKQLWMIQKQWADDGSFVEARVEELELLFGREHLPRRALEMLAQSRLAQMRRGFVQRSFFEATVPDLSCELQGVSSPVLLLRGCCDPMISNEMLSRLASMLAFVQVAEIPNVSHYLLPHQSVDVFSPMNEFWSGLEISEAR